jgi:hypothetical protein
LTIKVREGARTVIVDGLTREILGFEVTSAEDGAGWLAFFRSLVTRGLTGVVLVASDTHAGLVSTIRATLPGAAWQTLIRQHHRRRGGPAGAPPPPGDDLGNETGEVHAADAAFDDQTN